jgi:hypothetical protein
MPPTLLPEEQEAEEFMSELGLAVRRVPTSTTETPDFIVDGDARGYVLEVKARNDSEEWTRAIEDRRVAHQRRSMGHGSWAEDVAHKASKQFLSADGQHLRWWVLWLAIKCHASAEAMREEAIGSLFGVRQVVHQGPLSAVSDNCLFAKPGIFERHPKIVASVVSSSAGFGFCVNDEFADDYLSFRESVLWSSFACIGPPTTATELAGSRGFVRADHSAVDRRDDTALAAYLERVYGLKNPIMLDPQVHSASMRAKG